MRRYRVEELLSKNKFFVDDEQAHIIIHKEVCRKCSSRPCTTACPAGLYNLKDGELSFDYAGCLECGTCRVVCPNPGAIDWNFPRGGFGVVFRYG